MQVVILSTFAQIGVFRPFDEWLRSPMITMKKKEQQDTILIGDTVELVSLYEHLKRPERVLAVFCDAEESPIGLCNRVGNVASALDYLQENSSVRRVYCSMSQIAVEDARAIQSVCKIRAVKFCAVLPTINELDANFTTMHIGKQLLLTPKEEPLAHFANSFMKRVFDLLISILMLLTLFPVVYLVKYINAKRLHLGIALRVQQVCGPNGTIFKRLTFRTQEGGDSKGLDTWPQLLNVLMGRMSLVGPAPIPVVKGEDNVSRCRLERCYLKSGIVGWAQSRGHLGEDSLNDDIWYAEHWSLWLDLKILASSVF